MSILLPVCQLIEDISGAIVVTTPQDVAILDARKGVLFAKMLDIPFIGIIENMSGLICPHCHHNIDLFKKGGGERLAEEMRVTFLGRIPLEPEIVALSDEGKPFVHFRKDTETANTVEKIIEEMNQSLREKMH